MRYLKGAIAPFFSVYSPRLRDDSLLSRAIEALESGYFADAILAVEYVCRRYPSKIIPAILRAKILQICLPQLNAKAWYNAWLCEPNNAMVQNAMLKVWLNAGARSSVLNLGAVFLPERCQSNNHHSLIQQLFEAQATSFGACWKSGQTIEGSLFTAKSFTADGLRPPQTMRLIVSSETAQFQYDVPADGSRFKLNCPEIPGVWSVAFIDSSSQAKPQLLQGSPLVFDSTPAIKHPCIVNTSTTSKASKAVDIIIPVYRDYGLVKACIDSVLLSLPQNNVPAQVTVIDDASPESALSAWLDGLAEAGKITLLRNPFNLGFIESTNRGLRQHTDHDVVLLNADTLVQGDWLDRLRTSLYSNTDIASVTPWSNNGEISSFPKIAKACPAPSLPQLAQINLIAASLHHAKHSEDIEIPSCCGFAMMIRRSVLNQIGLLDGVELIRGYGEEVDWCLRARAAGYRHLIATGVFIAHTGTVSFGFEKTLRVQQNRAVLVARYPDYYPEYHRFIKQDPLNTPRQMLSAALLESNSEWFTTATNSLLNKTEFAGAVPNALSSSCARIAVWQHRISSANAGKVLALARAIASYQPTMLKLRLLVIGEANEALWHTGVVDVLPPITKQESPLLTDAALLGLSGCSVLLTESEQAAPIGIRQIQLDAQFEPQIWLADWLQQQAYSHQQN
jgi:GT2 family glycosyltransferase